MKHLWTFSSMHGATVEGTLGNFLNIRWCTFHWRFVRTRYFRIKAKSWWWSIRCHTSNQAVFNL